MKRAAIPVMVSIAVMVFASMASAQEPVGLVVNGQPVVTDVPAQIVDGRTLVPVRFVSEALGATVSWDAETRTAIVESPGLVGISDPSAAGAGELPGIKVMVDGRLVDSDVPAQLIDDRTMVPVRFVSEALGATVEWDGETRTVYITYGSGTDSNIPYVGDYGFSLTRPADWILSDMGDGIQIQAPDDDPVVQIQAYGADPFLEPALLSTFYAQALASGFGGDVTMGPVLESDATTALGTYEPDSYVEYSLSVSDGSTFYLRQWCLGERGWTFLVTVLSATPTSSAGPAMRAKLDQVEDMLASFNVTADSELQYEVQRFGDLELELPSSLEQYLDLGTMVGYANTTGTAAVLASQSVDAGMSVDELFAELKLELDMMYPEDMLKVEGERQVSIASRDAYVLEYQVELTGLELHGEEYMIVDGDTAYFVGFTMMDAYKDADGVRDAIERVLDSIRLGPWT